MAVYLDNAATTPMVDPAIAALVEAISMIGNASSLHTFGRDSRRRVEEAREKIAGIAGCSASEVIFTGSGTESNNLAMKGLYWKAQAEDTHRNVVVVSAIEHHAILDPAEWLVEHEGAELIFAPVDSEGVIELDALQKIVDEHKERMACIAVMHANNEVGSIQPIAEVIRIAGEIPVHCDAVQSFGKIDFNFAEFGLTSATISGHKIGGPLGVAALILKRGLDITPILHGGGQERDIRSGTLNAPGIIAFAAAANFAEEHRAENSALVESLRTALISRVMREIPDAHLNAGSAPHLPGIANITFPGTESDGLLLLLDAEEIATSTGSACSAGVPRASHVLIAMGLTPRQARSSLRFSLGISNTLSDIERLGEVIAAVVARSRAAMARS